MTSAVTIVHEVLPRPGFDLAHYGDAVAIVHDGGALTYTQLDRLVEQRCALLGSTRRLVLVECANALEPLVTYLAALRGRHPVLLVPAPDGEAPQRQWQRLVAAYDPDVVLAREGSGWRLDEVRPDTRHDLHPDLALLLGTSGSTGTPKLVRLSHENLRSNAAAVAAYLHLDTDSRAATTLPMHYCYGLSVLNSHLVAGGSLWLTDRSVVDDGFWDAFTAAGATSFAGVPYTFELLERAAVDWAAQPGLRHVTQAGGALGADKVRAFALRARRNGFDFFVMYGQTEATARMAYLPPHLAAERPHTIGVPIEGAEFRLEDGELVYSGPNVMLGYAESAADLAAGRTVTELRTGDLAVQHDDGLYELTGRRSRIAKLFGTRLDLDLAERMLDEHDIPARLVSDDRVLTAFVRDREHVGPATEALTRAHCVPAHAVRARVVDEFPITANGKPDHAALRRMAHAPVPQERSTDVRSAYEVVFGRPVADDDTFVGLGGDSLSYVEMVVRLERALGRVPADWPRRTVADLAGRSPRRRGLLARVETPLLLRAVAILLIVGSHVELWNVMGGAHALLVLFGYNLARFALHAADRRERLRGVGRTLREIALPASLWIGGVAIVNRDYDWSTALFLNGMLGSGRWSDQWEFWFLESVVWTTVAVGLVTAIPLVARVLRRRPLVVALGALGGAMALRLTTADAGHVVATYSIAATAWCVVLGWAAAEVRTTRQRLLVSVLAPVCAVGFFGSDDTRELVVVGATLLVLWTPRLLVVRPLDRVVAWVGGASLFVYLTHWLVYPHLERDHQLLALLASVAVGILVWRTYVVLRRVVPAFVGDLGRRTTSSRPVAQSRTISTSKPSVFSR